MPKKKIETSGSGPALSHNPFGALAGASAPQQAPREGSSGSSGEAGGVTKPAPVRGRVILRRETKHRAGKAVVVISGLRQSGLDDAAVAELARELKQRLACGGSVERARSDDGAEIVLQGDQPARVAELLRAHGFRVSGVTT